MACETLATTNRVVLAGEVRATDVKLEQIMAEIEPAVRAAVSDIGYEQNRFTMPILNFRIIYMSNRVILPWVLTQVITKMRAPVIRV